jgi:surfactin synthase thioesterase subunit
MSSNGLTILRRVEQPAVRLLCLPHAGGAASAYGQWHKLVPPGVEVCAIELPGRGARYKEPALTSMAAMVAHVAALLEPLLDLPYVLLGHSMGAVVALELTRGFCDQGRAPRALVAAGCRAPYLPRPHARPLSELPDEELVRELCRLEGLPPRVLDMPGFMNTFLPTIRADLRCREQWHDDMRRVDVPIHVLGGREDRAVPYADMEAWKVYSARPVQVRMFEGGHFFVRENQAQVIDYLATQVLRAP